MSQPDLKLINLFHNWSTDFKMGTLISVQKSLVSHMISAWSLSCNSYKIECTYAEAFA